MRFSMFFLVAKGRTRHLGNMGELDSSTCPIEEHVFEVAWEGWKRWKLIRTVLFVQKDLLDVIERKKFNLGISRYFNPEN